MVSVTTRFFTQLVQHQVVGDAVVNANICSQETIDPILFLKLIEEHRLTLFVLHVLKNHYSDQQRLIDFLVPSTLKHFHRQLILGQALLTLTQVLQSQHIMYVILKGAPLNQQLYGDKILRSSNDIDVLINVADLQRTHRLLLQAGYVLESQTSPEALVAFPKVLKIMKDVSYRHHQHRTLLELHWNIGQMADCNFGAINEQMRTPVTLRDKKIYVLIPEYNFIYLCFHASKHQWERLQWLVDIVLFYQHIPLDWSRLIRVAQRHYCLRPLLEAQKLLHQYFSLNLPTIPHTRQDMWAIYWRLRYTNQLWASKTALPIKPCHLYSQVFYQLLLLPRYSQKITFLWAVFWQGERALSQRVAGRNRVMIFIIGASHKVKRLFAH